MPQTLEFKDWLVDASRQLLNAGIISANLDAELILSHGLSVDRTYLHAHPEQIISTANLIIVNNYLAERLNHKPIAYIVGHKEFYGRNFIVTPATLIPRPESEDIITLLDQIMKSNNLTLDNIKLIDIGTGSGCLGITAKLEFTDLDVTLADISSDALKVATLNANALLADVAMLQSDLLQNYTHKPDIIIANLPYVDQTWDRSPETEYEPTIALFSDENGLSIIKKLIKQASDKIVNNGYLIIEADPDQHQEITEYAKKYSFGLIEKLGYALSFSANKVNV